jgi:hypothetical protein
MKSKWVSHQGHEIFYYNYTDFGQDAEGLKAEIEAAQSVIEQQPENSMLILVDIRGTVVSREVSALIKDNASHTKLYAKKVAVVGVKGVVRVIADSIGRLTRGTPQTFFDTPEEAKDWLISTE